MAVTKRIDGNTGHGVKIAPALLVIELATVAMGEGYGLPVVGSHEMGHKFSAQKTDGGHRGSRRICDLAILSEKPSPVQGAGDLLPSGQRTPSSAMLNGTRSKSATGVRTPPQ